MRHNYKSFLAPVLVIMLSFLIKQGRALKAKKFKISGFSSIQDEEHTIDGANYTLAPGNIYEFNIRNYDSTGSIHLYFYNITAKFLERHNSVIRWYRVPKESCSIYSSMMDGKAFWFHYGRLQLVFKTTGAKDAVIPGYEDMQIRIVFSRNKPEGEHVTRALSCCFGSNIKKCTAFRGKVDGVCYIKGYDECDGYRDCSWGTDEKSCDSKNSNLHIYIAVIPTCLYVLAMITCFTIAFAGKGLRKSISNANCCKEQRTSCCTNGSKFSSVYHYVRGKFCLQSAVTNVDDPNSQPQQTQESDSEHETEREINFTSIDAVTDDAPEEQPNQPPEADPPSYRQAIYAIGRDKSASSTEPPPSYDSVV